MESLGITGKALYYHLNRVLEERDMYIEVWYQGQVYKSYHKTAFNNFKQLFLYKLTLGAFSML